MAFVDALLSASDADVVMVDRRYAPGGHWLDAYPFVRLHQPSANYGVASRQLGRDRIDEAGINAGFYERATAAEICDYYRRVLDDLVATGRVRFLPGSEYRGMAGDGYVVSSLLTGADTTIRAGKLVDATYVHSEIPSRRAPAYDIDAGVRVMAPNDLVDLAGAPAGFTVVGAGKTSMDTCSWLLDNGVDPGQIRWVRARDPWLFERGCMQPLDLVGQYMQMQAHWVSAAAVAPDASDFAHRLEDAGVFLRIDARTEPATWRGAIISRGEMEALRSIERVERGGYVRHVGTRALQLSAAEVPSSPEEVYVDCTAAGVPPTAPRPVFAGSRIVLQYVTIGIAPWSAATIGVVEATRTGDADKNRLCPPLSFDVDAPNMLRTAYVGMLGLGLRGAEPDLNAWTETCRLNPSAGAMGRLDDPAVDAAVTSLIGDIGDAMGNLAARVAALPAQRLPVAAPIA